MCFASLHVVCIAFMPIEGFDLEMYNFFRSLLSPNFLWKPSTLPFKNGYLMHYPLIFRVNSSGYNVGFIRGASLVCPGETDASRTVGEDRPDVGSSHSS